MIPLDPQVTTIDLSAATPIQVARGSIVTDSDGTRQATLFFQQGTTATVNGVPLTTLNVRATEYTVGENGPQTMPGPLPPQVGYTYAVELSADEALNQEVRFSQPVINYLENFLNFPVGGIVPVGYYDRAKAAWIPSDNGRVIKILSVTSGLAALDTNGDGATDDAATLSALGVTDAERQQLAALYSAGQSLWRVPITHFTPWDHNWPFAPPADAVPPPVDPPTSPSDRPDKDCEESGSIIECLSQTLGEALPVTGTPFQLHYTSTRVPWNKAKYTIEIPLSGASLPASLQGIELEILVAGRKFVRSFPATPNQRTSFTWDGKDGYGQAVQGDQLATIRIGYVYGGVYQQTERFGRFGDNGNGIQITGSRTRQEVTLWQETQRMVGSASAAVGGWSLSPHHVYDPRARVLYLSDGSRRSAQSVSWVITTLAGTDSPGYSGDGGPATQAQLADPRGIAVASDGSMLIADSRNNRVRRIGLDGIITTVAGTGVGGYSGDGGPAAQAQLNSPHDVTITPDGRVLIADYFNHRIRRIETDGTITTVAGTGVGGYSGDGGPATQAQLNQPAGIAVAPDGSVLIADSSNNRVRRIGPDGIITTFAGVYGAGFSGDGGPARSAWLKSPTGVAIAPDGSVLIADNANHRIRQVKPNGIISTFAGNGVYGDGGDGGLATQANLAYPWRIAVAPDGRVLITDIVYRRIRQVNSKGIITTLAGPGAFQGSRGDGGFATQATLGAPLAVTVAPDGSVLIGDTGGGRFNLVRKISPALPDFNGSDIAIPSTDGRQLYRFSAEGRHLSTLDTLTVAVLYTFGYDSAGRLITITDGDNNVTTVQRDGNGNPTAIIASGGQRTTLAVDANGWLARVTNPAGETTQLSSSSGGLLQTFTDARNGVSRYTYNALGLLTRAEDPAGGVKTLSRVNTSSGYTATLTTALGRTRTYQVEYLSTGAVRRINSDEHGARTEVLSNPDGTQVVTYPTGVIVTTTFGPDPRFGMQAPRVVQRVRKTLGGQTETTTTTRAVTLATLGNPLSLRTLTDTVTINNARTFTRVYDAATRTFTDTSAQSRQRLTQLDAQGRVIRQQTVATPALDPVTFTYDTRGRLTEARQGSQFWTFHYDAGNRLIERRDAAGHSVTFGYDANDRLTEQTFPSSVTYQFGYDANGNPTQVILPSNAAHDFDYTPVNLAAAYTPPGNPSYQRDYNLEQQLTRTTLPGGRRTDWLYDPAGRNSGLDYAEASTTFAYFANDLSDRVESITHTPTAGASQVLAYTYNGSLITGMTATGAVPATVSYAFNNSLFPTRMNLTSAEQTVQATFTWDRDGLLTGFGPFTLTRGGPGGALSQLKDTVATTTYGYDTLARPATRTHQANGQTPYTFQLSYDLSGRIVGKTETVGGVNTTYAYAYDPDGQLTEVRRNSTVTERYTYDANGNRTSRQLGGGAAETATYDSQDRLRQRGAVTYQFDSDGFLTQRGSDTFQYSTRGQLLRASGGGQTLTYGYDGLGRRISRTDSGGTTQYIYGDPASHLITAVRTPNGDFTTLYYDTTGLLTALERNGVRYYVATDQVGTPRVVSDATGASVKVLDYDSFGNLTSDSNLGFDLPLGYAGGLADAVTGLIHFGFRDYDPAAGRWTARDPVLFAGGQGNLYVYVGNNPIGYRDPSGLLCVSVTVYEGVGGGVGVCITDEGASVCGEVGFGVGVGINADIGGGLEETGTAIVAEASIGAGPAEIGIGFSLDSKGCLKGGPKGQLGPVTLEKDKIGTDLADKLLENAPKLGVKGFEAKAKVAAKGCVQGKW